MAKFKHIVIIDDSELDRFVVSSLLGRKEVGEKVVATSSAYKGLEFLQPIIRDIKAQKISCSDICIFLDINMPFMDGKAFLGNIKKALPELLKQVYILSNLTFSEQQNSLQEFGVNNYLKKPLKEVDVEKISLGCC